MYHKHFHWPLQSHTSTFTGLCKVTQAHSLASASYTSIFTALWQVKPLFFSSFRTYIASFVFIEGSRHLHLFMYRCNNKILYWHIVFIIIYSHFKTLTGVKFCSYRMTNTFDIFYLFVSLFPVFLVCQRLQIICGCFTPVHQQGVLWAHEAHDEASWDEPFSEPICWKASKLHEASSRHHYFPPFYILFCRLCDVWILGPQSRDRHKLSSRCLINNRPRQVLKTGSWLAAERSKNKAEGNVPGYTRKVAQKLQRNKTKLKAAERHSGSWNSI